MTQPTHEQTDAPRRWGVVNGVSVWLDDHPQETEKRCEDSEVVTRLAAVSSGMIFGTLQLVESSIEDDEIEQGRANLKKWGVSQRQAGAELNRRGIL